jgi:ERCC4-type nuclease
MFDSTHNGLLLIVESMTETDARFTANEILLSLPGVNHSNYRNIINHTDSLATLSKMSESDLIPLIGPSNSKKLVTFFRQRMTV